MQEDKHIDDIFRNALLQQDIPVDDKALEEAMLLLDARKKKNVRVIYWISGLLGLLAIGVGLAFFFSSTERNTLEQRIETPNNHVIPEKSPQSFVDTAIQSNRSSDTSNESNAQSSKESSDADNIGLSQNSDTADLEVADEVEQKGRNLRENGWNKRSSISNVNQWTKEEPKIDSRMYTTNNSGSNAFVANTGKSVIADADNPSNVLAVDTMPDDKSASPSSNTVMGETQQTSGSVNENTESIASTTAVTMEIQPETNESDSLNLVTHAEDSLSENNTAVKPDFNRKAFSKWDVRLAGTGLYTYSTIGERNMYADVYAQQRNQQEKSLSGHGFDVSLSRNSDRSFMSLGLGYLQTRENIQYEATKTVLDITSEEYWEYESVLYMIVDGTGTNLNTIVWDTSFMEVNVDSTLFVTYDTTTTTTENTAITAFNGTAKWSHLYLPLVYGIRLDHKTKSSLYAVGSVEFDYLTSSTAHYLSSDGQSVKPMTDFPGYRRFMINGSVGIEWRKLLGGERMYLFVNPGVRTNLYSWNADFRHSTWSPYLRAGIGVRLFEK